MNQKVGPHVLAVGGCHLSGYIVGLDHGFVQRVFPASPGGVANVAATAPVSICRAFEAGASLIDGQEPAVVILQLGNYETGKSIRASSSSSIATLGVLESANLPAPNYRSRTLAPLLKGIVKAAAEAFGNETCSPSADAKLLSDAISKTAGDFRALLPSAAIVVVGPLPSAHFNVALRRSALNTALKNRFWSDGIMFLDALAVLGSPYGPGAFLTGCSFLADSNHLNKVGHARLAESLALTLANKAKSDLSARGT